MGFAGLISGRLKGSLLKARGDIKSPDRVKTKGFQIFSRKKYGSTGKLTFSKKNQLTDISSVTPINTERVGDPEDELLSPRRRKKKLKERKQKIKKEPPESVPSTPKSKKDKSSKKSDKTKSPTDSNESKKEKKLTNDLPTISPEVKRLHKSIKDRHKKKKDRLKSNTVTQCDTPDFVLEKKRSATLLETSKKKEKDTLDSSTDGESVVTPKNRRPSKKLEDDLVPIKVSRKKSHSKSSSVDVRNGTEDDINTVVIRSKSKTLKPKRSKLTESEAYVSIDFDISESEDSFDSIIYNIPVLKDKLIENSNISDNKSVENNPIDTKPVENNPVEIPKKKLDVSNEDIVTNVEMELFMEHNIQSEDTNLHNEQEIKDENTNVKKQKNYSKYRRYNDT